MSLIVLGVVLIAASALVALVAATRVALKREWDAMALVLGFGGMGVVVGLMCAGIGSIDHKRDTAVAAIEDRYEIEVVEAPSWKEPFDEPSTWVVDDQSRTCFIPKDDDGDYRKILMCDAHVAEFVEFDAVAAASVGGEADSAGS